jgi:transposase
MRSRDGRRGADRGDRPRHEPLPGRGGTGVPGRADPTANQSGPRKGRGKKGHGNTRAKRITVPAAYAAANTDTFPRERFRRPPSRPGGDGREKAGCAVGRSILVIVRHLLNDPAARYRDLGPDWHARHSDRSRNARNARRQLEALGNDVIITLREDAA